MTNKKNKPQRQLTIHDFNDDYKSKCTVYTVNGLRYSKTDEKKSESQIERVLA